MQVGVALSFSINYLDLKWLGNVVIWFIDDSDKS